MACFDPLTGAKESYGNEMQDYGCGARACPANYTCQARTQPRTLSRLARLVLRTYLLWAWRSSARGRLCHYESNILSGRRVLVRGGKGGRQAVLLLYTEPAVPAVWHRPTTWTTRWLPWGLAMWGRAC